MGKRLTMSWELACLEFEYVPRDTVFVEVIITECGSEEAT